MSDEFSLYNRDFFISTIQSQMPSSLDFARLVIAHFNPASIADIGCGCGIYLKAFYDLGIEDLIGYDGSEAAIVNSLLPGYIQCHDLRECIDPVRRFDLCLCTEVGEHMAVDYSETLVDTCIKFSDTVFFTAATPGQGGTGHLNEQPHHYWIELFEKRGYRYMFAKSCELMEEARDKQIIWWIAKNIMVFQKEKAGSQSTG